MSDRLQLPKAEFNLYRDPQAQAELEDHLERLKTNEAYYRSWMMLRESRVTGRITLKFDKGKLKGIEPCPYLGSGE
jgi:hypothetical protein